MSSLRTLAAGVLVVGLVSMAEGAERTVQALRTRESITLDGALDEAPWQLAEPAADLVQSEPDQGKPASEPTEIRVLYDADNLYFGVVCLDSHPKEIVASSLRLDFAPAEEDFIEILIDPFASGRDGFLFTVNPNGAKRDEQIGSGGLQSQASWNGVWDVRTQRSDRGWSAEVRIPFKTLRYERKASDAWLVNFGRQVRRLNELSHWTTIPRQLTIKQVRLAGQMAGLTPTDIRPGRNLQVTPYMLATANDRTADHHTDKEFGVDVKYGLTPGLTLDLTYNTDFSHVEADTQQVNLDRFRLSFPEKRGFFLENTDIFNIGNVTAAAGSPNAEDPRPFYSRNIGLSLDFRPVPIIGGGRLTGRQGRYGIGVMSIQTERVSEKDFSQGPENDTVVRVKRDVLARSYIGGFAMSRDGPDRVSNRVVGADALFQPTRDLVFSTFFAKSHTPGAHGDDWLFRIEEGYESRFMRLNITHANIQKNYRNDLGFLTRTGIMANRVEWRPKLRPWQRGPIREIQGIVNVRYSPEAEGKHRLLSREQGIGVDFYFKNGAHWRYRRRNFFERLDDRFEIRRGVPIPVGDYHFYEQGIEAESDRSRAVSATMKWYTGDFWNGEKTTWDLSGQYKPTANISFTVSYSDNNVKLPVGNFDTRQSGLRMQYSFSTVTSADVFLQYNNETHKLTSNVRFDWIHRPLSDLYLVYTEERPTVGDTQTDRVMTIKYTHLLHF